MRLSRLRLVDWRSVADAEIALLDGTPTLLYGENDAGKSNLLAGVETFCKLLAYAVSTGRMRAGESFGWVEHAPGQMPDLDAIELAHPVRYGAARASLRGTLIGGSEVTTFVSFDITLETSFASEERTVFRVEVAQVVGPAPTRAPTVLRVGEGRAFREEFLPDRNSARLRGQVSPDGEGAKLALFQCANHARPDMRARFYEEFRGMIRASPYALPDPIIAVGEAHDIQVLLDGNPIEHRGAGPQQWVLTSAMIAATLPDIVLLEEPETNLSWAAQQHLVDLLRTLASRRQVVVATHSPHVGNAAGELGPWVHVQRAENLGPTTLELGVGADALWRRYRRSPERAMEPEDPRYLTLFPGNILRLPEAGVRHLGLATGDVVVTSLAEVGVLRMESLERWLGDEDTSA